MKQIVSVIMPVYNTEEEFLRKAIESILCQTLDDFEFLIVNDGSSEACCHVINSYQDERIRIIDNKKNMGLSKSLNKAFRVAQGEYIARMDSDDIALPERLMCQVEYMEKHKDVMLLGTNASILGENKIIGRKDFSNQEEAKVRLLFRNIHLVHPTVMFRRCFLVRYKLFYNELMRNTEDYEFWTRCISYGKIDILDRTLLRYRIHDGQITSNRIRDILYYNDQIRVEQIQKIFGELSSEERELFLKFVNFEYDIDSYKLFKLLYRIQKTNVYYEPSYLNEYLFYNWFVIACKRFIYLKRADMLFSVETKTMWNIQGILRIFKEKKIRKKSSFK